jgi:hypothetical protein
MSEWLGRLAWLAHGPGLLIVAAVVGATLFTVMLSGGSND